MVGMTPEQFIEKWERASLKERASAQEHFTDLCRMLGHPTPAEYDPSGETFTFEYKVEKVGGGRGFVDVWFDGHFAIEYKGADKYNTLNEALNQLLQYSRGIRNPPLLVVTDIRRWEIYTNWTGYEAHIYKFTNEEIGIPKNLRVLRAMFEEPNRLRPDRTAQKNTERAADLFSVVADDLRDQGLASERIASFITRLVFTLFAEDVDLLPDGASGQPLFTEILDQLYTDPDRFVKYTEQLFQAMAVGGDAQFHQLRFFDGSLFDPDRPETLRVERLRHAALETLREASHLNWASVDPSIFGTLFERVLDESKRAQLGAHYTDKKDIKLIVEPVLMTPLQREWQTTKAEAASLRATYEEATNTRQRQEAADVLQAVRDRMLDRLRTVRVLDPACGSGNFLYVALQQLLDLECDVLLDPVWNGLPRQEPGAHPRQLFGIEINPIAHDLASIVVWIGYLQWHQVNGFRAALEREPLLERYDNILFMDAILGVDEDGTLTDPQWPDAEVIVSNPPFLGDKKMRTELGHEYVETLRKHYAERIPGQSDLVCYWFEQARLMLENGKVWRVGLLATNSIRGGANRAVLDRIKNTGDIFMAWSDRPWILEGAAVRVSMVGFDDGQEQDRKLDGFPTNNINADLSASVDITIAAVLGENQEIGFVGDSKKGVFDVAPDKAQSMLKASNKSGRKNRDVIVPWISAIDIARRPRSMWIVDFGMTMPEEEATLYEQPYEYIRQHVKPARDKVRNDIERTKWWIHGRPAPAMREAVENLKRYIATPIVAKHRLFVWMDSDILPSHAVGVIARSDDYFFGVLHSRLHEVWALRMGTWLGKGNDPRYTPTTTFETYPFPWPPGQEEAAHPAHEAISDAARQLHEERAAWLNPSGVSGAALKKRTLTNLYNALVDFRQGEKGKNKEAADFAPHLNELHGTLDRAVCDAYGWPHDILADEEEILRQLLALNLERAAND